MKSVSAPSQLFTLRLWPEPRPGGEAAWRAKVTHVLTGEARYFREWERLIGFLEDAGGIAAAGQPPDGDATDSNEALNGWTR